MGQHLGALDYLLPEEYTSTLKVLHSQAPQSSMQEVCQVIREDLGKEVSSPGGRDETGKGAFAEAWHSSCCPGPGCWGFTTKCHSNFVLQSEVRRNFGDGLKTY